MGDRDVLLHDFRVYATRDMRAEVIITTDYCVAVPGGRLHASATAAGRLAGKGGSPAAERTLRAYSTCSVHLRSCGQ